VQPIGRSTHHGFGHLTDGTPIYEWESDDFPDSPGGRALRNKRADLNMGLREAAAILGLRDVELSGLERGEYTCDFLQAIELLQKARH
jgi:hypothetical protein